MKILADSSKKLVVLINCTKYADKLLCGAAVFQGGLSGTIAVGDEYNSFLIKIPESVGKSATKECYADEYDSLEFELCAR